MAKVTSAGDRKIVFGARKGGKYKKTNGPKEANKKKSRGQGK